MKYSTPQDVENYYDTFSQEILLENFLTLNYRQEKIIKLCQQFIPDQSRILEIGCGVGLITKTLQTKASSILATDISPKNIEIAQQYLAQIPHCKVQVLDALEEDFPIALESVDIIILADVIEHIPANKRPTLFTKMESVLAPQGRIILTLPSPEYQLFLKKYHPGKLQIIDETVYVRDLLNETNLQLLYFRYVDVWQKNQYLHIVLQKGLVCSENQIMKKARLPKKILNYIKNRVWRARHKNFVTRIKNK